MDGRLRQEPRTRCVQAHLHCVLTHSLSDYLRVERDLCLILPGGAARRPGLVVRSLIRASHLGVLSAVEGDAGRHVDLLRVHRRRHRVKRRVRPSIRLVQATEEFAS